MDIRSYKICFTIYICTVLVVYFDIAPRSNHAETQFLVQTNGMISPWLSWIYTTSSSVDNNLMILAVGSKSCYKVTNKLAPPIHKLAPLIAYRTVNRN